MLSCKWSPLKYTLDFRTIVTFRGPVVHEPQCHNVFVLYHHILTVSCHTSEVLSPVVVTVTESGATSVRLSWGPLQPQMVTSYFIEYSALPRGELRTATVHQRQNSTLLRDLQPGTTYLVTITARYASGKEKAMSVKVCTEEGE